MLFFMVFLIFCKVTYVTNRNAGSALFNSAKINLACWNVDDVAKLQARKAFEEVIPLPVVPEKVNNRYIKTTLAYFRNALMTVQKDVDRHTADILKEALCDTIGAHLNSEILPTVRFAYYAGYIRYKSAKQLHNFLDEIKIGLNTHGVGWKPPPRVPQWSNLTVTKIAIGSGKLLNPCACLITKRDANNCIHLPIPRLDDDREPSAIALPFKREGLVSLTSPMSENILLKYYTAVARCILHSSPHTCRHADFVNFNNELWHWMKRDIAPHLVDNKLYTAFGGVLRIAAAVQNYGKGLQRRNLFEYPEFSSYKWNPWKSLTKPYIYINADWPPAFYVILVILTAIAIWLLQICYNYMFGEASCKAKPNEPSSKDISYVNIDSSDFPSIVPQPSKRLGKFKASSVGSLRTQRVYDLNENTEKLMPIIVSGNEDSDLESTTSKIETDDCELKLETKTPESRPKSPPKIETSIAQLTLEKPAVTDRSNKKVSKPMFSTSTLTRSEVTFCQVLQQSESAWSISTTSSSDNSISSTSSKSRSQRSKSSRDLAWARHVISKHSRRGVQSSGTELDGHSFMTPPSRRQ